MLVKYKLSTKDLLDLPLSWLFKDYYRVTDEKLFLLLVIKHGIVFETISNDCFEWWRHDLD